MLGRKWIQKKIPLPEDKKNKRPKGPPKIECMGLKNPVGSPRAQKEKSKKLKSHWTRRSLVPNLPLFLWLLMLSCLPVSWATCVGNPRNGSLVCNTSDLDIIKLRALSPPVRVVEVAMACDSTPCCREMAEWSGEALVPSLQFVHDRDSPAKSVGLPMCEIWGASLALFWLLSGGGSCSDFKRKKNKRKQKRMMHFSAGLQRKQSRKRHIGICRKVGKRRFRKCKLQYRRRALKKHLIARSYKFAETGPIKRARRSESSRGILSPYWLAWHSDRTWDPQVGERIGEAKNPGPAGSRKTERLRRESVKNPYAGTRVGEASNPGPTTDDQKLAATLMSVLQSFQTKTGKGKGTSEGKTSKPSLAVILSQTLKSAIDLGWSDDMVAERMSKKIQQHMCTPASAPQVGHPRQQRQSFYCQDFDVSNWDYQSDFPPLEPEKTIKETVKGGGLVTKGKGKGKPKREDPKRNATEVTPNKNKTSGQPHGQRCAKSCDLNEWQANAKLTTIQQIKQALENGECQPGNLVLTRDIEVLTELQNIWAAHDLGSHALTVGVLAAPMSTGPVFSVWWDSTNQASTRPQKHKFDFHKLGDQPGPQPKPAVTISIPNKCGPQLATLRILGPQWYRKHVVGSQNPDTPLTMIKELATLSGVRVSTLTGGNWQTASHKRGSLLVGHLRMPLDTAKKLLAFSGAKAIFLSILANKQHQPEKVVWVPKKHEWTDEVYLQYCCEQAKLKRLSVAMRQGGGNDLGLIGGDTKDFPSSNPRHFNLHGAPRHWDHTEVQDFLHSQQWTNTDILTRRSSRNGSRQPEWLFKAFAPVATRDQVFWHYEDSDSQNEFHLTISPEGPRKRKLPLAEWITPPKKKWVD